MQDYEAAVFRNSCRDDYWYFTKNNEKNKSFVLNPPESEILLDYHVEPRNYAKAGKASSDIKLYLKKLGVKPDILRKIAIACYEAEINVVAHSKGGTMEAYIYNDCVLVVLEDEGPGIEDLEKAMEPGFSTADDLAREMGFGAGLGLPNIKKNSDIMHLSSCSGCNTKLEIVIFFEEI